MKCFEQAFHRTLLGNNKQAQLTWGIQKNLLWKLFGNLWNSDATDLYSYCRRFCLNSLEFSEKLFAKQFPNIMISLDVRTKRNVYQVLMSINTLLWMYFTFMDTLFTYVQFISSFGKWSSPNFAPDFSGNRSYLIRLISDAKFGDDPQEKLKSRKALAGLGELGARLFCHFRPIIS